MNASLTAKVRLELPDLSNARYRSKWKPSLRCLPQRRCGRPLGHPVIIRSARSPRLRKSPGGRTPQRAFHIHSGEHAPTRGLEYFSQRLCREIRRRAAESIGNIAVAALGVRDSLANHICAWLRSTSIGFGSGATTSSTNARIGVRNDLTDEWA